MIMRYAIFIFMVSISFAVCGQTDSVTFTQAKWKKERLKSGVWFKSCSFDNNLFNSSQVISVVEIKKRKRKFDLGYDPKVLKLTSEFGKESGALVALNGTFFDIKNGGSVDFIQSDGQVINENRLRENGNRADHQKAAVVLDGGRLEIAKWDGTADWEKRLKGEDIMTSGPLLILDFKPETLDSTAFAKTRHPRTAIAVTKRRVLLIAVDGRDTNAAGMNLFELSKVLRWLGAEDGINLDGGGSTTLWIKNYPENGVVNYPSDNKVWDHVGERKVANVILIRK